MKLPLIVEQILLMSSIWMDMIGEGYVAFLQTLLMGRFRYWCQNFILWWPSTVCWGIFCCWWWVCADDERSVPPEEGIHQVTGPKGLGGRSCHSTPWTIILPPSPKFTKGSSGNCHQIFYIFANCLAKCRCFYSMLTTCEFDNGLFGRCPQMLTPGLSSRASPIGAILTIGSRHSTRSFC